MELLVGDVTLITVFSTVDPVDHLLSRADVRNITLKAPDNLSSAQRGLLHQFQHALFICSQRTLPGPKQDIHQLQRTFREHSQQLQRLSTSGNVIRDNKCIRQHIVQRISACIA